MFRESLPRLDGKIRLLHAATTIKSIDIYANGNLLVSNFSFGDISKYSTLSPGEYLIEVFNTGTYDEPLFKSTLEVLPNMVSTVSIVISNGSPFLFNLRDSASIANQGVSFLRFINLSPNSPLLSLSLSNDEKIFNSVEYLETTGYTILSPGIYDFKLTFSDTETPSRTISAVTLSPGQFKTLYIIGLLGKEPQIGYILSNDGRDA